MILNAFIFRFIDMVFFELNTSIAYVSVLTVGRDHRLEHVSVYLCLVLLYVLSYLFTDLDVLKVAFYS
jgi:hypothetical protein